MPSRPSVAMKAKASGTPAKLEATPEKVITAERRPRGRAPRISASVISSPNTAPSSAEAAEIWIEIV